MNSLSIKVLTLSILFLLPLSNIYSQSKYGKDSIRCIENFSIYKENEKLNYYDLALPFWRIVFVECPGLTKNIFIDGIKMYKYLIDKEDDPANKAKLIDTLMFIYAQRIEYFGERGLVLGRKGIDFIRYKRQNIDDVEKGYKYLSESINLRKDKSTTATIVTHMTATCILFRYQKLTNEEVLQNYITSIDIIKTNLKKKPDNKALINAKENIQKLFENSGAATCEALISLFTPKCKKNPDDIELLKEITGLLSETKCTDSDLFFETSENLHSLEPSVSSAYNLALLAANKKVFEKAVKYYKIATELESDNKNIGRYYVELCNITFQSLNNPSLAHTYAYRAIEADKTNGYAYILIGHIYGSIKNCGENDFEKKALYWAAVDKYQQAKLVDPSLKEEADKYIEIYTSHFPDNEIIFFNGYEEGQTFIIDYCWINIKTTVRSK